jgi:cytochrome c-type biogenesis protein CcmH/NrfG
LYLGAAYEGQNKITEALDAFTKASDLSSETDPELTVMARTRMASLLQKAPLLMPTDTSP